MCSTASSLFYFSFPGEVRTRTSLPGAVGSSPCKCSLPCPAPLAGGMLSLQRAGGCVKCFYHYTMLVPHVLAAALCWGTEKGSTGGVQLHGLCCPGLVDNMAGLTPLLLCHSPDQPSEPRHHVYLLHTPGRQQDGTAGEMSGSCSGEAILSGPKQLWARPAAMASDSCHGNHGATIAGACHGDCGAPKLGRERRGFI